MRGAPLLLLALVLGPLLAGCVRVGPGEDVHMVCERRSHSPWHPYPPEVVANWTQGDAPADVWAFVAHHLVTPGARPYRNFTASIEPAGAEAWRFTATGAWELDGLTGTDQYDVRVERREGRLEDDVPGEWVRAPESLRALAAAHLEKGDPPEEARGELQAAHWDRALPSCVRLTFAPAEDGESPPAFHVWVNVARGTVVLTEKSENS